MLRVQRCFTYETLCLKIKPVLTHQSLRYKAICSIIERLPTRSVRLKRQWSSLWVLTNCKAAEKQPNRSSASRFVRHIFTFIFRWWPLAAVLIVLMTGAMEKVRWRSVERLSPQKQHFANLTEWPNYVITASCDRPKKPVNHDVSAFFYSIK